MWYLLIIAILICILYLRNRKRKRRIIEFKERKVVRKPNKPLKILVGTDGSDYAMKAVEYSAGLAVRNDGNVILLHVVALDSYRILPPPWLTPEIEFRSKKFIENLREVGELMLRDLTDNIKKRNVKVSALIELGNPAEKILEVAERSNADMIVVGARGLSKWKKIAIGSVSENVLNESKVPVLIVR